MLFNDICLAQENRTDPVLNKLMGSPQEFAGVPLPEKPSSGFGVLCFRSVPTCLVRPQKCRKTVAVGLHILDRPCRNAGLCCRGCDGQRDIEQDPLINRFGIRYSGPN